MRIILNNMLEGIASCTYYTVATYLSLSIYNLSRVGMLNRVRNICPQILAEVRKWKMQIKDDPSGIGSSGEGPSHMYSVPLYLLVFDRLKFPVLLARTQYKNR